MGRIFRKGLKFKAQLQLDITYLYLDPIPPPSFECSRLFMRLVGAYAVIVPNSRQPSIEWGAMFILIFVIVCFAKGMSGLLKNLASCANGHADADQEL